MVRVENMFEQMKPKLPHGPPHFIVCLLPDRKNSDIYGSQINLFKIVPFHFYYWFNNYFSLILRSLEKEVPCRVWNF